MSSPAEQPMPGDPALQREPVRREPSSEHMPEARPAGTEPEGMGRDRLPGVEMDAYRRRFESVQAEFIDEPRRAVEKAKSLVEEAIDRMMNELKRDAGSGDDTEQLRLTLKRYRDMLYTLGERMR